MGSIDGVNLTAAASNVSVRNGVIRDFQGLGVSANTPNLGCLFADLRVSNCGGAGIRSGLGGLVSGCSARENVGLQIALVNGAIGHDNSAP